ncbi:MAG: GerMN domain-containing protein [Clostridia bacterium]
MKLSTSQRKLYLLSAILLALTLVVVTAWGLWRVPDSSTGAAPAQATPEVAPGVVTPGVAPEATPGPTQQGTIKTVVYYQDNYGYLVPVTRTIPEEKGVAKATLSMMVQSAYNDMEAARLGLRTVLPEGTNIDLDVVNGVARVDLGEQVLKAADAEAENNMVSAVVQTLTEFPTIKQVEFLIGGKKRDALTYGTPVSAPYERGAINLESAQANAAVADLQTVELYFPGDASSLIVPVTRTVYGASDLDTAVLELVKGPSSQSPLDSALPSGCGLIGVSVKDGVATVNFTREFMHIAEESDGGRLALRALMLTCTNFDSVKQVQIQVEGKPYDPGATTLASPTFVNDASSINQAYVATQTASILDMD